MNTKQNMSISIPARVSAQTRFSVRWKWAVRHSCKKCLRILFYLVILTVFYWAIISIVGLINRSGAATTHPSGLTTWQINAIFALSVIVASAYVIGLLTAAARIEQFQTNLMICLFGFAFFLTLTVGMYAIAHGDIANGNFSKTSFGQFLAFLFAEILNINASLAIAVIPFFLLIAPQLLAFLILGPMGYAMPLRLGRGVMNFMLGVITKGFITCAAVFIAVELLVVFNDWPRGRAQSTMEIIYVSEVLLLGAAATCWAWSQLNVALATSEVGAVTLCVGRNARRKLILNGNAKLL